MVVTNSRNHHHRVNGWSVSWRMGSSALLAWVTSSRSYTSSSWAVITASCRDHLASTISSMVVCWAIHITCSSSSKRLPCALNIALSSPLTRTAICRHLRSW